MADEQIKVETYLQTMTWFLVRKTDSGEMRFELDEYLVDEDEIRDLESD